MLTRPGRGEPGWWGSSGLLAGAEERAKAEPLLCSSSRRRSERGVSSGWDQKGLAVARVGVSPGFCRGGGWSEGKKPRAAGERLRGVSVPPSQRSPRSRVTAGLVGADVASPPASRLLSPSRRFPKRGFAPAAVAKRQLLAAPPRQRFCGFSSAQPTAGAAGTTPGSAAAAPVGRVGARLFPPRRSSELLFRGLFSRTWETFRERNCPLGSKGSERSLLLPWEVAVRSGPAAPSLGGLEGEAGMELWGDAAGSPRPAGPHEGLSSPALQVALPSLLQLLLQRMPKATREKSPLWGTPRLC